MLPCQLFTKSLGAKQEITSRVCYTCICKVQICWKIRRADIDTWRCKDWCYAVSCDSHDVIPTCFKFSFHCSGQNWEDITLPFSLKNMTFTFPYCLLLSASHVVQQLCSWNYHCMHSFWGVSEVFHRCSPCSTRKTFKNFKRQPHASKDSLSATHWVQT